MPKPYSIDLTDAQGAIVEPLRPPPRPRGRRPTADRRRVLNAIHYVPRDFPTYTTVYRYIERWSDACTLAAVYEALHRRWRRQAGRSEEPSVGAIDSRSVQAAPAVAELGNDYNRRVMGRKQHLCVDTALSVTVPPRAWLRTLTVAVDAFLYLAMTRILLDRLAPL